MRKPALRLSILVATLVLSCTSASFARRFEPFPASRGLRIVYTANMLNPGLSFIFGGQISEYSVTLEGRFLERTLPKVEHFPVALITRATVAESSCGWPVRALAASLPWSVRYEGYEGALPNIRAIRLAVIGASFLITVFEETCLYRSTSEFPFVMEAWRLEWNAAITAVNSEGEEAIRLASGGFICPSSMSISGTGEVTVQGATERIALLLIA